MKRLSVVLIVLALLSVAGLASAATYRAVLAWTDNSNNEDGFRLERRVGTGAYATLVTLPAGTQSYVDDGPLAEDTLYCYRIFAFNAAGDSDSDPATPGNQASEVCANPPSAASAPTAPGSFQMIVITAPAVP